MPTLQLLLTNSLTLFLDFYFRYTVSEDDINSSEASNVKLSKHVTEVHDFCKIKCSVDLVATEPSECPMPTVKPSHPVNYDCASPNHNGVPSFRGIVDHKSVMGNSDLDQFGCNRQEERQPSLTEINFKISELPSQEQSREKPTGRNWDLIIDDDDNFLIFDSSPESQACKKHNQLMRNHVAAYSALSSSNLSKSNNDDSQEMRPYDFLCVCSSPRNPTVHLPKDDNLEVDGKVHTELIPQAPLTCCKKPVNGGLSEKMDAEAGDCVSLRFQVELLFLPSWFHLDANFLLYFV